MEGDRRPRGEWPVGWDLPLVAGTGILAAVTALLPVLRGSPLRAVLGLALALFLPGYALAVAVFPERSGESALDPVERVAVAVASSLLVSMALGVVVGLALDPGSAVVLGGLSAVTVAGCGVAAIRRQRVDPGPDPSGGALPSRTLQFPRSRTLGERLAAVRSWPGDRPPRGIALDVLVVLAVVVALAGVVYLVAVPKPHAGYAELSLLSAETAGADATGYPASLAPGESASVVVGVEHHRPTPEEYAVVVVLQRIAVNGSDVPSDGDAAGVTVRSERVVRTDRRRLAPGARWTLEPSVSPDRPGRYRLVARLHREDTTNPPVHRVHLWIDVGGTNRTASERGGPP